LLLEIAERNAAELTIALNGQSLPLLEAELEGSLITFELSDPLPVAGWNVISVTVEKLVDPAADARPAMTRLELRTDYDISGVSWDE